MKANGHAIAESKDAAVKPAPLTVGEPTVRAIKQTPTVRVAGPADEQEVFRLLLLAHAENAVFPASNARVMHYVRRFLNPQFLHPEDPGPRGIVGVIGRVGALEALAMLGIGQMWYSDNKHIEEYFVFVDPNFRRGTGHAMGLIRWMKEQCRKTGLSLLTGIMSNHRTEAKCRLYRSALPKIGEYFMFNPHTEGEAFYSDELTGPGRRVVTSSSMAA